MMGTMSTEARSPQPWRIRPVLPVTKFLGAVAILMLPGAKRADGVTIVYIEYGGRKWYSSGPTVEYSPSRFTVIGKYHDLPVYGDRRDKSGKIYIPVEKGADSLLAPYARRR